MVGEGGSKVEHMVNTDKTQYQTTPPNLPPRAAFGAIRTWQVWRREEQKGTRHKFPWVLLLLSEK